MTYFEMDYRNFDGKPQRHQLSIDFKTIIEKCFENHETSDIDTTTTVSPNMVEPMVNRNFGNTFHRKNGPNQN